IDLRYTTGNPAKDPDRICAIGYGSAAPQNCNVLYDGSGNIKSMPTSAGVTRSFDYLASGRVRTISDNLRNQAHHRYDAFGDVAALDLDSGNADNSRRDRRFGSIISRRDETVINLFDDINPISIQSVVRRTIPGPAGFVATRDGSTGGWVFAFA